MNIYESHNHSKFKIRYHIILSVKYHKQLLGPIIEDVKQSFKHAEQMSKYWKIEVVETDLQVNKDHHVHVLVKAHPQIAPYEIVSRLKQISTYDMWKKHHQYLRQFYWNGKHLLWTKGFFVCTVGDVSEKTLKKYIEQQG